MINKHKEPKQQQVWRTMVGIKVATSAGDGVVRKDPGAGDLMSKMPRDEKYKGCRTGAKAFLGCEEERPKAPSQAGQERKEARVSRRQGGRPEGLGGDGTDNLLVAGGGLRQGGEGTDSSKSGVTHHLGSHVQSGLQTPQSGCWCL